MHRGVEKLFEVRDYRQVGVLANRHDWLSAFSNELGVALAVERMLGIEVPVRATWLRTLLSELNRAVHHLTFISSYPAELAEVTAHSWELRERLVGVLEEVTGGRMHYMFNRVGGLKEDIPAGWLDRVAGAAAPAGTTLPRLRDELLGNELFRRRTVGVGVLTREAALAHGVSGAVGRASGLDLDLRRDEPYLAYQELASAGVLRVPVDERGDANARFELLVAQLHAALEMVDFCAVRLRELPRGPVNVRLPKNLKVPEGETYAWTESPGGLNGYYLVSHGGTTPWRLKLRTPGFNHASALAQVVVGCAVPDLVAVIGSMFFVMGDVDK
jgi:NADH-quinone oxidoreductase subunit D